MHASAFLAAAQDPAQTREGIITTFAPVVEKVAQRGVPTIFKYPKAPSLSSRRPLFPQRNREA
jgi:hypothetical protein